MPFQPGPFQTNFQQQPIVVGDEFRSEDLFKPQAEQRFFSIQAERRLIPVDKG